MRWSKIWLAAMMATASSIGFGFENKRILPELGVHLDYGMRCAQLGQWDRADAASDLLLLPKLRLYIEGQPQPSQEQALAGALDIWRAALGDAVVFEFVRNQRDAEVTINFRREVSGHGQHFGGFATWRRGFRFDRFGRFGYSLQAQVQLRTVAPNGQPMTVEQMRHSAAHELGHILGLADSHQVGDLMGPLDLRSPVDHLRSPEMDALFELRRQAEDIRHSANFAPFGIGSGV